MAQCPAVFGLLIETNKNITARGFSCAGYEKGEKHIMRIDLDYIKKWMKISDEELMERLVKDAVGLQEEAREREHQAIVKERMQDKTYNTAFMREFFASYNYLHDYFSDKEILIACKHHAAKSDMAKEIAVRGHRDETSLGIRFVKHTRTEFTESRSGWSRTVMDNGTIVLMTSPYQSRFAGKVIEELLLQKLPYLKDFAVSIHGIYDKEQDLIFIKNPEKAEHNCDVSLYISAGDLLSRKTGTELLKRHKDYWHDYGNGKYDDATEKFLAGPFVQRFLAATQEFADKEEN